MAANIPSAALTRDASEKDLQTLSRLIGSNWEMLAPILLGEGSMTQVDHIKDDHRGTTQRIFYLLLSWRRQTDDPSLAHLFHLMYKAGTCVTIEWRSIAGKLGVQLGDVRACKDGYQKPMQPAIGFVQENSDYSFDDVIAASIAPDIYQDYLTAIKDGEEEDNSIRLMIIGCFGQGKTTLARRLMSQSLEVESTNGIDIYNLSYNQDENALNREIESDPLKETMKRLAAAKVTRVNKEETETLISSVESETEAPKTEISYSRITATSNPIPLSTKDEKSSVFLKATMNNSVAKDALAMFQKVKQEIGKSNNAARTHKLSLWDFGGQFVFYATHQLFHSRNAVYLLVFDLHKDINSPVIDEEYPDDSHPVVKTLKDYIEFWVSSVHSYVGNKDSTKPQIILVGTHKDKIKDEVEARNYVENIRKMFEGRQLEHHLHNEWFAIAGTDMADNEVDRLRKTIVEVGRSNTQEVLPASWMLLEYALRQQQNIVKFKDVMDLDNDLGTLVGSEHQMKSFLKFQHTRGTYIYFDEGQLAEFVILKPQFVVDAFKCIITSQKFCRNLQKMKLWSTLVTEAKLTPELLNDSWSTESNEKFMQFKDVLLAILKRHRIISEAMKFDEKTGKLFPRGYYIVPSFLKKSRKNEIEDFLGFKRPTTVSLVYVFGNEAVVPTVYQRITGAAVGSFDVVELNGNSLLFENAGVYFLDQKRYAGIISFAGKQVELLVASMCIEEKINPEVTDFFRRFTENVVHNEFRKFKDFESREDGLFKFYVRCQHSYHCCRGSKSLHDLELLKDQFEIHSGKVVCCPDNSPHDSINIECVLHEWFSHNIIGKDIRKDEITRQELAHLSTAIGAEWKVLGGLLGIHKVDIDHIDGTLGTPVMILEMLEKWQREKEDMATLDVLVREIKKLSPESVKTDVINNVINKIY